MDFISLPIRDNSQETKKCREEKKAKNAIVRKYKTEIVETLYKAAGIDFGEETKNILLSKDISTLSRFFDKVLNIYLGGVKTGQISQQALDAGYSDIIANYLRSPYQSTHDRMEAIAKMDSKQSVHNLEKKWRKEEINEHDVYKMYADLLLKPLNEPQINISSPVKSDISAVDMLVKEMDILKKSVIEMPEGYHLNPYRIPSQKDIDAEQLRTKEISEEITNYLLKETKLMEGLNPNLIKYILKESKDKLFLHLMESYNGNNIIPNKCRGNSDLHRPFGENAHTVRCFNYKLEGMGLSQKEIRKINEEYLKGKTEKQVADLRDGYFKEMLGLLSDEYRMKFFNDELPAIEEQDNEKKQRFLEREEPPFDQKRVFENTKIHAAGYKFLIEAYRKLGRETINKILNSPHYEFDVSLMASIANDMDEELTPHQLKRVIREYRSGDGILTGLLNLVH